jgi:hypothetical protein
LFHQALGQGDDHILGGSKPDPGDLDGQVMIAQFISADDRRSGPELEWVFTYRTA